MNIKVSLLFLALIAGSKIYASEAPASSSSSHPGSVIIHSRDLHDEDLQEFTRLQEEGGNALQDAFVQIRKEVRQLKVLVRAEEDRITRDAQTSVNEMAAAARNERKHKKQLMYAALGGAGAALAIVGAITLLRREPAQAIPVSVAALPSSSRFSVCS